MRKAYFILEGCSNKYDNTRIEVLLYMLYANYQKLYKEENLENLLNIRVFHLEYNMALRMSSI